MPNIGPVELIIILVIALLILGPGKLPEVGSAIGKSIREFRKATTDVQDTVTAATIAPPAPQPAAPVAPAPAPAPAPVAQAAPVAPAPVAPAPVPNTLSEPAAVPNTLSTPAPTADAPTQPQA